MCMQVWRICKCGSIQTLAANSKETNKLHIYLLIRVLRILQNWRIHSNFVQIHTNTTFPESEETTPKRLSTIALQTEIAFPIADGTVEWMTRSTGKGLTRAATSNYAQTLDRILTSLLTSSHASCIALRTSAGCAEPRISRPPKNKLKQKAVVLKANRCMCRKKRIFPLGRDASFTANVHCLLRQCFSWHVAHVCQILKDSLSAC